MKPLFASVGPRYGSSKDVQTSFISLYFAVLGLYTLATAEMFVEEHRFALGSRGSFLNSLPAPPCLQLFGILMALFGKLAA